MAKTRRTLSAPVFRWFALADFTAMIVIILTGAAVRLTGSGLGCPDWPTCFQHRISGSWSLHPLVEYANRMVTGSLIIVTVITFVAALLRSPKRKDLVALSGALIGGVFLDAILGAIVVYTKLNPWLVSLHMMLSLFMVVVGATLYHRSKYIYGEGLRADVRDPFFKKIARSTWFLLAILLYTGTLVTGSGPHAGSATGQLVAKRLPIAFSSAAWVHSVAATLFIGVVVGLLVAIWKTPVPEPVKFGVRRLMIIAIIQAAIGVIQFLTHVPVLLVGLHVAGATSLTIGVTQFNLRQTARDREPGTRREKISNPASN